MSFSFATSPRVANHRLSNGPSSAMGVFSIPLASAEQDLSPAVINVSVQGNEDFVDSLIEEMMASGELKSLQNFSRQIRAFVEAKSREISSDFLRKLMGKMISKIFDLINGTLVQERLCGVVLIEHLVDVQYEENESKIIKFANYLRMVVKHPFPLSNPDRTILIEAAKATGQLARSSGTLAADFIEYEVQKALEWLQDESCPANEKEHRRYASALILKELILNAPTLFNPYIPAFLDHVWIILRDPRAFIRHTAIEALAACLEIIHNRNKRLKEQWYQRIFTEARKGFGEAGAQDEPDRLIPRAMEHLDANSVHGSLLVYGELLSRSNDFMLSRFKEVCETVLLLRDHKSLLIQETVIYLIPIMAKFCPEAFVKGFLDESMLHIINYLRHDIGYSSQSRITSAKSRSKHKGTASSRETAFQSIGLLSLYLKHHISPFLDQIISLIEAGIHATSTKPSALNAESLKCLSLLARAVGAQLVPRIYRILDEIFKVNLSEALVSALTDIAFHIKEILPLIQRLLLFSVSRILLPALPTRQADQSISVSSIASEYERSFLQDRLSPSKTQQSSDVDFFKKHEDPEFRDLILLALRTLGSFNMSDRYLDILPFIQSCLLQYLSYPLAEIRREAALTICSLVILRQNEGANQILSDRLPTAFKTEDTAYRSIVFEVVEKLLMVGVSDPEPGIRVAVYKSLDSRFDVFLCRQSCIKNLLISLNDEFLSIRRLVLQIVGRVMNRNPAFVMPSLRRYLIQLLTEIQFSNDNAAREESSKLLTTLIDCCEALVMPYVSPMVNILLPQLSSADISADALAILGVLAKIGAKDGLTEHLDQLFPVIVGILSDEFQESATSAKSVVNRDVALKTLGQLVKSSGKVIDPYIKFPGLLPTLLNTLVKGRAELDHSWGVRREAFKVIGILGALDPLQVSISRNFDFGVKKLVIRDENRLDTLLTSPIFSPGSDDYNATVVLHALMGILSIPALSQHHNGAVQAVIFIFKSLGMKSIAYLNKVVPALLRSMRTCDDALKESLFQKLVTLVSIVKQHILSYLPGIFEVFYAYWDWYMGHLESFWYKRQSSFVANAMWLLEEISLALPEEFKMYLVDVIPRLLSSLSKDASIGGLTLQILNGFRTFGSTLLDYVYLFIPPLLRLCEQPDIAPNVRFEAVQTIRYLCLTLDLSSFSSRIVHAFVRILRSSDAREDIAESVLATLCILFARMNIEFGCFLPTVESIIETSELDRYHYAKVFRSIRDSLNSSVTHVGVSSMQTFFAELQLSELSAVPVQNRGLSRNTSSNTVAKLLVNQQNLRKSWQADQLATKEDWIQWMQRLSLELLKESASPALRSCSALAQKYNPLAKELFNSSFTSCWNELHDQNQDDLTRNLHIAFQSINVPHEILQTLLDLAEFMERTDQPLPIDISLLASVAEECHAYARALHYREMEFHLSPNASSEKVEALISINNKLQQPEAASGVLEFVQKRSQTKVIELKPSWYEKLNRWEDALDSYERRQLEDPDSLFLVLGRLRCLRALNEWKRLHHIANEFWDRAAQTDGRRLSTRNLQAARSEIGPLAAAAAWNLGYWDDMRKFASAIDANDLDGAFYRAVIFIRDHNYRRAHDFIERSRVLLDRQFSALLGESYDRAYPLIVKAQQLSEMEEIIALEEQRDFDQDADSPEMIENLTSLKKMWAERLNGCKYEVDVWQEILLVRSLVLSPNDDITTWLKFASLCRRNLKLNLSSQILTGLLGSNSVEKLPRTYPLVNVSYIFLKHLWFIGSKASASFGLSQLVSDLEGNGKVTAQSSFIDFEMNRLMCHCCMKLAQWKSENLSIESSEFESIFRLFELATEYDKTSYKAWHSWALLNYQKAALMEKKESKNGIIVNPELRLHVVASVRGFFTSIGLGGDMSLQDTLRLLNLWFKHGSDSEVEEEILKGFENVSIDTWLSVIPQILARIHISQSKVKQQVLFLLSRVGRAHPQALVYPLTVASKSLHPERRAAALEMLQELRSHSVALVDQANIVSHELIRVAIIWHEMWHEALEEASRMYFVSKDIEGMLKVLEPLHEMLEAGAETQREVSFDQSFGKDLKEAYLLGQKYRQTGKEEDISRAWDIYCQVFSQISSQIKQLTDLELQYVSPKLLTARDLSLAVPGTYTAGQEIVRISHFSPTLRVIESKQRPRKLSLRGSDGKDYEFLLKGHEDLRQDERVMQLFGLVNRLLRNDRKTHAQNLSIKRYSAIPLAPNSGLIEWLGNCDTLHVLIKEYREARRILLNIEHRLMNQMSPDYQLLNLPQKVEVFEYALSNTTGQDLFKVLWLNSSNSEVWLYRRTNYTRSLAVMSMVGYILGLGDRHPCNLMLDRVSGKIIHIDFGDCFEVAMEREKYPETIPFRLTRMLVNAMEISGIEGNFRTTCENVMHVLRDNKESLMAVLEAFVYDPLINWRLLKRKNSEPQLNIQEGRRLSLRERANLIALGSMSPNALPQSPSMSSRSLERRWIDNEDSAEVLNSRAISVISRVSSKLTGTDFDKNVLNVHSQVSHLIEQATSIENLCQCYVGWCPFW